MPFEQAIEKFKPSGQVEQAIEYNKIIVPRGGEYNLVLADGTSVMINSDSKLSVPDRFEGKRTTCSFERERHCFTWLKMWNILLLLKRMAVMSRFWEPYLM